MVATPQQLILRCTGEYAYLFEPSGKRILLSLHRGCSTDSQEEPTSDPNTAVLRERLIQAQREERERNKSTEKGTEVETETPRIKCQIGASETAGIFPGASLH